MKWLFVVVAVLAAGCPRKTMSDEERKQEFLKGLAPLLAKHKAAMTGTLDALEALPKAAAAEPAVTRPEPLPAPIACKADTCQTRTIEPRHGVQLDNTAPLNWDALKTVLRGEYTESMPPQLFESSAATLDGLTSLAVVRVRQLDKPVVTNNDRYTGGRVVGDVIVYDLKTKKRAGAFPWEVGMPVTASIPTSGDVAAQLERTLLDHVDFELRKALADFYAGKADTVVKPPVDDADLRERQIIELLAKARMIINEVEITEEPACKVVLVTVLPGALMASPPKSPTDPGDGVAAPAVNDMVRKVMAKDCAVSVRSL